MDELSESVTEEEVHHEAEAETGSTYKRANEWLHTNLKQLKQRLNEPLFVILLIAGIGIVHKVCTRLNINIYQALLQLFQIWMLVYMMFTIASVRSIV